MDLQQRALASVRGRTVVVTGASSGIGRATALALGPAAGRIVLIARRAEALADVARQLGGQAEVRPCDLRDTEATTALGRELSSADLLIANAGHSIKRDVLDYTQRFDTISRTAGINYLGAVALALPILAAMAQRGRGHLIGITTATAAIATPGWSAYAASKAAFDTWLRCVGPELKPHGIDTTIVRFPLVDTPMVRRPEASVLRGTMTTDQAAGWLLRAVADRPALVAPWWLRVGEVLTAAFPVASSNLIGRVSRR